MSHTIVENCIGMDIFIEEIKKYVNKPENLLIFDIGSRDGNDAKLIGNSFKNSNIYAFEAHPEEYKIHKEANNDIHWINIAIYDYDGKIKFYPKTINSGIHSIRDRGELYGKDVIEVNCCKVSSFLKNNNLRSPDVVKIDVEGCSLEVLKSFEEYISEVLVFHIESETQKYFKDQYLEESVFGFLKESGFKMTTYSIPQNLDQHDSIWINNKIITPVIK